MKSDVEAWLRGPIEGVPPYLMPAAHALVQAVEDAAAATRSLNAEQLWARPGGAASIGFHLRHMAGVIERLLTYARGEALSDGQLAALRTEPEPADPPASADALLDGLHAAVEGALAQLCTTPADSLLDAREVGRMKLPSTVLGLIFHAAEHVQRHTGQVVATSRILRG